MISTRFVVAIFIHAIVGGSAPAQSWLPNPEDLLAKADSAIRSIESISYKVEHFTIGILKYRDKTALLPPSYGEVKIVRLPGDEPFGAKIVVNGVQVRTQQQTTNSTFEIAYDGQRVRKLDKQKQIVYVNELDQTGQRLFLNAQSLILWSFISNERLEQEFTVDSTNYAGVAVIAGIPCYIVYTQKVDESSITESWWFFGFDDYLPRKIQRRYRGIPGQERIEVTILTELNQNAKLDAEEFVLEAPQGYEVKEYQGLKKKSTPSLSIGDDAPGWNLSDSEGNEHTLSGLRGKIVVMDFWATWCGSCIKAMPKLQELHERFVEWGVFIIGISTWEGGDPAAFMLKKDLTYQLLVEGDEVAKAYGVSGLPTLYVIGPNGKIVYGEDGTESDSYDKLIQIIEEQLEKK